MKIKDDVDDKRDRERGDRDRDADRDRERERDKDRDRERERRDRDKDRDRDRDRDRRESGRLCFRAPTFTLHTEEGDVCSQVAVAAVVVVTTGNLMTDARQM